MCPDADEPVPHSGAGRWPACYDELWNRLCARHGKQNGTRAMVAVLALGREFGHDRLRTAIIATVSQACDVAAVRYLLTEASLQRAPAAPIDVGELARYDRPLTRTPDGGTIIDATRSPRVAASPGQHRAQP